MAKHLCLLMLLFGASLHGIAHAENTKTAVQIRGSTTLLPIAQQVAEAYMSEHPENKVILSGGGTERGYKAIVDGTADIAMASGVVPEVIADQVEQKNIKLKITVVDYDAIVAVVHPSNPVNNLSAKQLKAIFSGRIKNWSEVGGADSPIEVFVGIPTGGITETWKRIVLGDQETYTPAGVALASEDRMQQVMEQPQGISYLTMGTLHNNRVKILDVDGISVNKKTVVDGTYTLRVPLMLVTNEHPTSAASNFIQYFLDAPKATLVREMAHIKSSQAVEIAQ